MYDWKSVVLEECKIDRLSIVDYRYRLSILISIDDNRYRLSIIDINCRLSKLKENLTELHPKVRPTC